MNIASMKKTLRVTARGGLLGVVLLLSACPWDREHGIVILPTQETHLRLLEKGPQVKDVLSQYSREIFLIRSYNRGAPGATIGSMNDLLLERPLAQFDKLAAANKFNGYAVQIGVGLSKVETDIRFIGREPRGKRGHDNNEDESGESPQPSPSASTAGASGRSSSHGHSVQQFGKTASHGHLIQLVDESAELIKEIEPIIDGSGDSNDKPKK